MDEQIVEGRPNVASKPPLLTRWLVRITGRDRIYDIGRIRAELGHRPVVHLDDGLAQMKDAGKNRC